MESEKISGYFLHIIYRARDYLVARFNSDEGLITVTGPAFEIVDDTKYTLSGSFVEHPRYGFQFNYYAQSVCLPDDKAEIIRFLCSDLFKGIGIKSAQKIYEQLGKDCLQLLKTESALIEDLPISQKQKQSLLEGLEALNNGDNEVLFALLSFGFSNFEANRILYVFKDAAAEVLLSDPFLFYLDVKGISFKRILELVKNYDFADKEQKFKRAFIIYLWKEKTFASGDTYLLEEDFKKQYSVYYPDFDTALANAIADGYLKIEDERIYLQELYVDEKYIAEYLNSQRESLLLKQEQIAEALLEFEKNNALHLDDDQRQAVSNFFLNDISIVTGGPGTGKTTLIKALVELFKKAFPYHNLVVAAPTGRAAKRIAEVCEVESKTLHSLLKWNKEDDSFAHNEDNPLLFDVVIVDEFSMVDTSLFASLLKAGTYLKKICLIGDVNQLPSIRQGNVLFDLIDAQTFALTYLTSNHRQQEGSAIIKLANDIINNCVDFASYGKDVSFITMDEERSYEDILFELLENTSVDDLQLLSPMYKGKLGIDALNSFLQQYYNPADGLRKEKRSGQRVFRENDKILQLKNRPVEDVYNGDIGILEEIDEAEHSLMVNYQGTLVFYPFDDLQDITLAYCMSVHKAQGSEYRDVIFITYRSHQHMLYKQLIYTAVTRCKKHLVIIGDKDVFLNGCQRSLRKRQTALKDFIYKNKNKQGD